MSRASLARAWTVLGGLLAVYAIGTWIILQGGKSFAQIPGLEEKAPVTSAYQAVLVVGTLLGLLSVVGLFYVRTSRATDEPMLPVVALAELGPHRSHTASMRLYQGFFAGVFLLVPAASLWKLNDAVFERGVLWHEGDPVMGGIAVKNAIGWPGTRNGEDAKEAACAAYVTRKNGFVWLANMRCDIAKSERLIPFQKTGKDIKENASSAAASCSRDLAIARNNTSCEGVRDVSEECEQSERHCRGMQWLPVLSPLLLAGTTAFGWLMLAWLVVELLLRKGLRSSALEERCGSSDADAARQRS